MEGAARFQLQPSAGLAGTAAASQEQHALRMVVAPNGADYIFDQQSLFLECLQGPE